MLQAGRLLARLRRIATHSFGSEYPRTSASGSPSPAATATSADADGEVSITKILFLGGGVFTIGIAEAGAKKAGASQPARIKPTTNQKIPAHAAFKQYTQLLGPAPPNK